MATLINQQRQRYAWIAGAMLWVGWLISVTLGPGMVDLAGQVIGTDYLEFYAAGTTVRIGESARLYDVAYQIQLQQAIIGPQLRSYYGFITPPFLAWLFVPLSALPYLWSFAIWSLLGLLELWVSLRLLGITEACRPLAWAVTFFPVFAAISHGQNSLLSLALLSLVYWLGCKGHGLVAGLTASLLLYKPQLLIGVALLWLLEWLWGERWTQAGSLRYRADLTALLGLGIGGAALAGMTFWLLPAASRAYVTFARAVLPDLPAYQEFPLWNLHTVWGFWRLLLPGAPAWADALYWLGVVLGVAGFLIFWRRHRDRSDFSFAAAICVTLWITPHAMIYDWTLLLIPAVLLWQELPERRNDWRIVFAVVWIAAFVSGPLTRLQLRWLPAAIQVSVPALLTMLVGAWRQTIAVHSHNSGRADEGTNN